MAVEPLTPDALVAEGLVRDFGARLVGPCDLRVGLGEVVALVGPNGSGKTTFIRVALGIDRAADGHCAIFGRRVDPLHPPTGVGYVPDRAEFWDWLDAHDNLRPFAPSGADIDALLERVGLTAAARRPVRAYSRGMRQRLSLGRALANDPALLVLDEPTIALDEGGVELLMEIVREQTARNRSVVVASHDESFVRGLGGRIVRFADGRPAA
jgi:ABC-type multidrug transport system ATPase subunit